MCRAWQHGCFFRVFFSQTEIRLVQAKPIAVYARQALFWWAFCLFAELRFLLVDGKRQDVSSETLALNQPLFSIRARFSRNSAPSSALVDLESDAGPNSPQARPSFYDAPASGGEGVEGNMIVGAEHQSMNNLVRPAHSHGPSIGARLSRCSFLKGLVRRKRGLVGCRHQTRGIRAIEWRSPGKLGKILSWNDKRGVVCSVAQVGNCGVACPLASMERGR